MKPSYNDIELVRNKNKHDIAEMLRSDASINNAHYILTRDDGREHPYVLEIMVKSDQRFYQLSESEFNVILKNFEVQNKIIE